MWDKLPGKLRSSDYTAVANMYLILRERHESYAISLYGEEPTLYCTTSGQQYHKSSQDHKSPKTGFALNRYAADCLRYYSIYWP